MTGPAGQPHTGYTTDELRLLGSSATSTQSAFNRPSKAALAGRARRSASVGSLPSLEQIRAWSQKRHGVTSEDQTIPAYSESHCTSDPSLGVGRAASTPIIQVLGASPPRIASPTTRLAQLASILGSTASNPTRQRAISVPSSPEKASYHVHADINRKTLSRTFCAKQMVSVLERRRSLSMVH